MVAPSEKHLDGILYVNKKTFAEKIGRSYDNVLKLIKSGKIKKCLRQIGKNEMIDLEAGRIEFKENTDPTQNRRRNVTPSEKENPDPGKIESIHNLNSERAKKEHYEAKLSEIKLKERMGELVSAEEIVKDAQEISQKIRNAILNIPKRVGPELAALKDPFEVEKYLDKEFRNVLEDLSREFENIIEVDEGNEDE